MLHHHVRRFFGAALLVAWVMIGGCKSAAKQVATHMHRDALVQEYIYKDSPQKVYLTAREIAKKHGHSLPATLASVDEDTLGESKKTTLGKEWVVVRFKKTSGGHQLSMFVATEYQPSEDGPKGTQESRKSDWEFQLLETVDSKRAKEISKEADTKAQQDAERFAGCVKKVVDS